MCGSSDDVLRLFAKRDAWTNVDAASELGILLPRVDHVIQVMQAHGCLSLLWIDYPSMVSHLNLSEKGKRALEALQASSPADDALGA